MHFFLRQRSHNNPGRSQHWVEKPTDEFYCRSRVEKADSKFSVTILTSMCLLSSKTVSLCHVGPRGSCDILINKPHLIVHLGFFLFLGSTSTRNSSQKGSSVLSIKQKSKKEFYMEKLQEHLIKAKAFTIKKWVHANTWVMGFILGLRNFGK